MLLCDCKCKEGRSVACSYKDTLGSLGRELLEGTATVKHGDQEGEGYIGKRFIPTSISSKLSNSNEFKGKICVTKCKDFLKKRVEINFYFCPNLDKSKDSLLQHTM